MSDLPPKVVATVGLHGSASTWAFNVVRELMIAALGDDRVRATYADTLGQLSAAEQALDAPCLVIKSHQGSPEIDDWLREVGARLFVSLRDPRDAALSMAQRFKVPLRHTTHWLLTDCARLARLLVRRPTTIRYEDRPFDDPGAVRRIADICGVSPSDATAQTIFERYRTDAVRDTARRLGELPPERLASTGASQYDIVTHIHGPHIGNLKIGKWRDLEPEQRDNLTRAFCPYLDAFGYQA